MSWPQSQWQQPPGPQLPPTSSTAPISTMVNNRNAPPPGIAQAAPGTYPSGMPAAPPSYTPTQFAALTPDQQFAIQQNWQQWQTYHQQYAQWHAQYGEQYQREMQAKLGMVAPPLPFIPPVPTFQPTVMPPSYASVPPPPPDHSKLTSNAAEVSNIVAATSQPPPPPPPPPEEKKDEVKNQNNSSSDQNRSNTQNSWPQQQQWQQQQQQQQQKPPHWQSQQQTWQTQPQAWQPPQSWTQPPPFQNQNQNMLQQNTFQQQQQQQQQQATALMRQPPPQISGQSFNQSQQSSNNDRRNFNTTDLENKQNRDSNRDSHDRRDNERDNRNLQDWRNNNDNKNRGGNWQNQQQLQQQQQHNYNSQQSNYSSVQRYNQTTSSLEKNNVQQQFNQSTFAGNISNDDDEEKSPEERIFDEQFRKWEEDFEKWKKENANHPDRKAYKEYEMKFEDCRRKLLERREQMRKRKLENKMKQQNYSQSNVAPQTNVRNNENTNVSTKSEFNTEENVEPKRSLQQHSSNYKSEMDSHSNVMHNFETALHEKEKFNSDLLNNDLQRSFADGLKKELKNEQKSLESKLMKDEEQNQTLSESQNEEQVVSNKTEHMIVEEHNKKVSIDHTSNDQNKSEIKTVHDENEIHDKNPEKVEEKIVEFLKTTKTEGGIPGLDLVLQSSDKTDSNNEKVDEKIPEVIDLETESKIDQNQNKTDVTNNDSLNKDNNDQTLLSNFPTNTESIAANDSVINKDQQQPRIPSLLDQKIEKPTFSPPRNQSGPSFGQFLNENLGSNQPNQFNQANMNNPEFAELANALSNPNVLALLTAALSSPGGDINKILNVNALLNNSNTNTNNSTINNNNTGSSPWVAGQEPFQNRGGNDPFGPFQQDNGNNFSGGFGGNRNMMGGGSDGGRGGGGNSWRDRQNNFSWDNRMNQARWQGGGIDDFRRGNRNWNDNRRLNNSEDNIPFDRKQNLDTDTRDSVMGSNTGPELMNEQSQSSEKSDRSKVNSFKDNDDNNSRRENIFDEHGKDRDRNRHNQSRIRRDSCDRSRSSSRQGDVPTNEVRNPRNPFRTEPRNIFDDTSMSSGGNRDRSRSRQRGDDYFRPAHVIDYQNKSLNAERDVLFPTKVVDYGHKSSNIFGGDGGGPDQNFSGNFGNNLISGGSIFGSGCGRDEFFPMKTIDYGHSSARNDQQNQRYEQGGEGNQNNRFNNNNNNNSNNNNNNQRGGKNRRNKKNRQNRWAKSGPQENNTFSQDTWAVGNESEKIPQKYDDITTAEDGKKSNEFSLSKTDNSQIRNYDRNDIASNSNELVSEQKSYQNNLDEISENETDFDETDCNEHLSSNYDRIDNDDENFMMEQRKNPDCLSSENQINENFKIKNVFPIIKNYDNPFATTFTNNYVKKNTATTIATTATATTTTTIDDTMTTINFSSSINNYSSKFERNNTSSLLSSSSMSSDNVKLMNPSIINNTITIDEILLKPGRNSRPKKIVIILRGPPGSGKTYVAKLIKEKEVEMGGSAPRLLSIDDYFMSEVEKEEKCVKTGRKIITKEMIYEYDKDMEGNYMQYLLKSYKKTINDRLFDFVIVDSINSTLRTFTEFYNIAKEAGFMPYTIDLLCDLETCLGRNVHNRTKEDIENILLNWRQTPEHYMKLDVTSLLQSAAIQEVEMEDISDTGDENISGTNEESMDDDDDNDGKTRFLKSKWDVDPSEDKLARLDGTSKPLHKSTTMEDYLQSDEWEPAPSISGKKRVRWADIEEKRTQEKLRAIGFIVGHTDWNRMMDPSGGSKALTKTKYIERVKR